MNQIKHWFLRRGELNLSTRRKASQCRVENHQTVNSHMTRSLGIEPDTLLGGECSPQCASPVLVHRGLR